MISMQGDRAAEPPRLEPALADALPALRASTLFRGVPDRELEAVASRLRVVRADSGDLVLREGEPGDACYVVRSGRVGVVSQDLIGQEATLATFGAGACFGEIALVTAGPRTATVRALEPTELFALYRGDFELLETACPTFAEGVRHRVALLTVDAFLRRASPFAHLAEETRRALAEQFRAERFSAGDVVIHEGEPGDRFYLVRSGGVEVLRGNHRVQLLGPGDCFGEVSPLTGALRTATVRVVEPTELLWLGRADFDSVVRGHSALRRQFREFIRIRVGDALARRVAATDPLTALMPHLRRRRRQRSSWFLAAGLAVFILLSLLASLTGAQVAIYGALLAGAFVAPIVYVTFLADAALLPERPVNLAMTFLLAAAFGLPFAFHLERLLGAHPGSLGPAFLVAIIEETAKVLGAIWLLGRWSSRFEMDGVVYGAAAGMGFAAFETVLYGLETTVTVTELLSTLWLRALLSPFGHGTWTALVCGALWRGKVRGGPRSIAGVVAAFGASVGLHTLWDWLPFGGILGLGWFLLLGFVGLELLRWQVARATDEALSAVVALNPELARAGARGAQVECSSCGQLAPAGTHYCVRCGVALRA